MVTRWSPDTCDCIVEYDDSIALTNVISTCPFHSGLGGTDITVFNTLMDENPRKNKAYQAILDNGPTTIYDLQADGSRTIKNGINISWTWSGTAPNRVLTLTLTGATLTTAQKNAVNSKLSTLFGAGKAVLA